MVDFERLVKNNTFLVDFADEMNFDLQQRNGQRIFGPPRNEACLELDYRYEVYIGNIPPDCFEDELLPLFSKIPQLYTFRLMLNFEGLCRGFAFAKYKSMESARRACNICDAFRVRYNARLRVVKCRNYSRIYIGEFATLRVPNFGTSLDPVLQVLYSQLVDMKTVSIYCSSGLETAYYVIEFYNHHKAALARRMLIARRTAYFAGDVAVDWVGQAILNMEMFRRYGFRLGGYFQLG